MMNEQQTDILIIGTGQEGLALAYHLKSTPLQFIVLESNQQIGDNWRRQYDAFTLFTHRYFIRSRRMCSPVYRNKRRLCYAAIASRLKKKEA